MLVSFNDFKRLMFWYFKGSALTFFAKKWICLSLISLIKSLGGEETLPMVKSLLKPHLNSTQIIAILEDDRNRAEKSTDAEH